MPKKDPKRDAVAVAGLLEQLTRRMHAQGFAARLFPAQWTALRYIENAPPHLRSAVDLARFQGLAPGAVARTVRTLIGKGLIEKTGKMVRGRAEQLELTDRGRQILRRDPLLAVVRAADHVPEEDLVPLRAGLGALLRALGATRTELDETGDGSSEETPDAHDGSERKPASVVEPQ
ncbi:MarR family transcriptional regulator [Fulvimarina endophytica]|uniref:MarR family transcriptional regulator n=1 Tax=Fulvimarina endophytica TaxID=2293836 RepID=A0A371X8R3_9HYPH|nr:MarR family winged helix-turn-helix transcriptional regulator [Fulvimarina endophytica]RFC65454.1 MarR family transcriptional regulator [Fulvimarina endophytica]